MSNSRFLLAAVNSKFIHSNLAVRYLKKYSEEHIKDISIKEFSINDNIHNILKELFLFKADVIGFSCYIWNIEIVLKLCSSIKKASPDTIIILGGPEVSFDPSVIMASNDSVDFIVSGEGEATFLELAMQLDRGEGLYEHIKGITYRSESSIIQNPGREMAADLDELPFPYDDFGSLENKIIYYESSRGCPYNCQYCLSSTMEGVRHLPLQRVKSELEYFIKSGVKQVKFVDRTFNCNKSRTIELIRYITGLNPDTNFHFEVAADIMDKELLEAISAASKGLFQFEIGIQTTNSHTLEAIKRPMDIEKVKQNVKALKSFDNAHLHLDLIAGLPYEDYISFKNSFNDVYGLEPHMLQLGFLKLLKGSGLRAAAKEYGIEFHGFPPYEVISTNWLSYEDVLRLKDVEHILESYYNSGRFQHSLKFIIQNLTASPFDFYEEFSSYWNSKSYYDAPKSLGDLFYILNQYITSKNGFILQFNELLKLDWLKYGKGAPMPANIKRNNHLQVKEKVQNLMKDADFIRQMIPGVSEADIKAIQKTAYYELFSTDVLTTSSAQTEKLVFFLPLTDKKGKEILLRSLNPDKL